MQITLDCLRVIVAPNNEQKKTQQPKPLGIEKSVLSKQANEVMLVAIALSERKFAASSQISNKGNIDYL